MHTPTAALVRPVSPRLAEAELTHLDRTPVDVERAVAQHAAYCALLADLGLRVRTAPAADAQPDGVFVEDTAVVVDGLAVVTRPGARSRRSEPASIAPLLEAHGLHTTTIEHPGTLDGGDVLQVGRRVLVGRTTRTDDAGIAQLRALLAPLGRDVVAVDVPGALHLKTATTALPDGTLLAVEQWIDTAPLTDHHEVLHVDEPAGANVLLVGDTVVVAASAPATAARIAALGWDVRTVDISEFERVEAGVTCLSVLLP